MIRLIIAALIRSFWGWIADRVDSGRRGWPTTDLE